MPTPTLVELNAAAVEADLQAPIIVDSARLESNKLRLASCLTRYDLKKNCIHIHN